MAVDANWMVLPCVRLGKLEFYMSSAQVDALSDVYDAITGRGNDRVPDAVLPGTLETFGNAMSEEEKQAFIAAYAGSGPSSSVTETRGTPGLVLRYTG